MMTFVLVVHLMLAVVLIGVILMQRSEGGALGIGGGGGLFTSRGQANLLTRTTAILATCFIGTSIILAILAGGYSKPRSILDAPSSSAPAAPAQPAGPAVPLSR